MRSHDRPTITGIAHVELSVSDVDEKLDEQALKEIVKAAVGHNLAKTRPAKTRARSRSTK